MKGVIQMVEGDPTSLIVSDSVPMPGLEKTELLIRVNCCAVNQLDLLQASGMVKAPAGASDVLGLEISGTIVQLGKHCSKGFQVGDNVMALLSGGGYAEFVAADERCCMPCVPSLSLAENASIPEAFLTAYGLLFFTAKVKAGDRVLIHAGASTVGQALTQMASLKGAVVVATTRSSSKVDICYKRGATEVLTLTGTDFETAALASAADAEAEASTGGTGGYFDVVFDPVGSSYLEANVNILRTDGLLVLYGLLGNSPDTPYTPAQLLQKILFRRISIIPSTLRTRDILYKADLVQCFMGDPICGYSKISKDLSGDGNLYSGDVTKMSQRSSTEFEQKQPENDGTWPLVVNVDKVYPLEDVLDAHASVRQGKTLGKTVMSVSNTTSALDWFAKQLDDIKF